MNKKIVCLVLFLITIVSCNISNANCEYINENTNYRAIIEDDAELITDMEEISLLEQMKPLTEFGNIIYKSILVNNKGSSTNYSEQYYYSRFGNASGTQLLVDMDERYIIITSAGGNYKSVTKSKANSITDNVYKYASNKQYYECASKAFEQVADILNGNKIMEPMKYINNALLALIMSLLINFVAAITVSKVNKIKEKEMINNIEHYLNINDVSKIPGKITKVYSPQSSGSSSGGGGGGGGFSGGSGGHSF